MYEKGVSKEKAFNPDESPMFVGGDNRATVELDPDHPGFRDKAYRERRNAIAQIAVDYKPGQPIPNVDYLPEEHDVWRIVREKLRPEHEKHACTEYLKYADKLELPEDRIPQLNEVSEKIYPLTGFRLEPVAGLVSPRGFLEVLKDRVFLATQYIRHYSVPLYTPEPDIVHEVIGHSCQLASPIFADINRVIGKAVARTKTQQGMDALSRIFWFTIEFGVVMEDGEPKAYGAGLLSSAGELDYFATQAELVPIDFHRMATQEYDVTQYQPILFYADSFDHLQRTMYDFFNNWHDDYWAQN
ncbi:MAG: phenylalanine 4-monooxygenase [Gemmatimonadetes bacterium]|nr:MAG: phenylalanine 4-monooxygenase [Gemmatimonadota bacterium]